MGGPGTTITINGLNLSQTTAVFFGSQAAQSFSIISDTIVIAIVGNNALGPIKITSGNGNAYLDGFTFYATPVITSFEPSSGPKGTAVSIEGLHLNATSSVRFGGVPAAYFTNVSDSLVTAYVGDGGSGTVSLISPGGVTDDSTFLFTGTSITGFSPAIGTNGTTVTIHGTYFKGATNVSFGQNQAASYAVISDSVIMAIVGTGSTGTITVSTPSGKGSFSGFEYISRPIISSFSPHAGPVGSTVIINGAGFGNTPAANTVYFGASRATVISANSGTLKVVVPTGATMDLPTITTNFLTAYAAEKFIPTFANNAPITDSSFGAEQDFAVGRNPQTIAATDFDGDGKTDLVVACNGYFNIYVLQNISSGGIINFSPYIEISSGEGPQDIRVADLNGDGKPDLAVLNTFDNTISIFANTSAGSVSFQKLISISLSSFSGSITSLYVGDLDGDGRPDIAVNNVYLQTLYLIRNTDSAGSFRFAEPVTYSTGVAFKVEIHDFDEDGKPDLIIANEVTNSITTLRNISTPGTFNFDQPVSFQVGANPIGFAVGDLTGDDFPELVVANSGDNTASVFLNKSSPGKISLQHDQDFPVAGGPVDVEMSDINGDGKPDVSFDNRNANTFSIFENTGNNGTLSFGLPKNHTAPYQPINNTFADLDGDGKPDIALNPRAIGDVFNIAVYKNRISKDSLPIITQFTPVSAPSDSIITIRGSHLTGTIAVSLGGTTVASFKVISDSAIAAVVGIGSSGKLVVTTATGIDSLAGFTYLLSPPVIQSFFPDSAITGTSITIRGKHFSQISAVSFGGTTAAVFTVLSDTLLVAVVGSGASGNFSVQTPGGNGVLAGFTYLVTPPAPKILSFTPDSAGTGKILYIHGTHFLTCAAIAIGGTPAGSFIVLSDSSIQAVIANGSTGYIRVSTNYGTDSMGIFRFSPPIPSVSSFSPSTAGTGTTILISGRNFTSANGVLFGGVEATSFTITSDSTITAMVGIGSSGLVEVRSSSGAGSLAGFLFLSVPVINKFSPDSAGTGATVTITGSHFTGMNVVYFGGTPATSLRVLSDSLVTAVVGDGTSGALMISGPSGTASLAGFVYIPPAPVIPVLYSFAPTSARQGDTIYIHGSRLSGTTAVDFAAVPAASFFAVSDSLLMVIVGPGSTGNVDVTNASGLATLPGFTFIQTIFPELYSFSPSTGKQGDTIYIRGNHLRSVTTVTFGGVPAAFNIITDSQMVAIVGPGATGNLEVSNAYGSSAASGFIYFSSSLPAPVIHSFSPMSAAAGAVIQIDGLHFSQANRVHFGGVDAASFVIVSDSVISATVGGGESGAVAVWSDAGYDTMYQFNFIPPITDTATIFSFTPTSGSIGTSVTISGHHLSTANAVFFGGTRAQSFQVISDSLITAVVANGSSGLVYVKTQKGSPAKDGFTFTQPVPPTLLSFSPQSGKSGTTILITGSNLTGTTSVLFGGVSSASFTVLSDSVVTAVVGEGASGPIELTTADGNSSLDGFIYEKDTVYPDFQLIQFKGSVVTNSVVLEWSARNEEGIALYTVERGTDSTQFQPIGTINPYDDTAVNNYTAIDSIPRYSTNYYRLRIRDRSGNNRFSNTVTIPLGVRTMNIYPNPAHGHVISEHPSSFSNATIKLYDLNARLIRSYVVLPNTLATYIDLSGVPAGIYQMVWIDGSNSLTQMIQLE